MSNNLVSQQLSMQTMQMGQLQPPSSTLDSSMQMGIMGQGASGPALQQMPVSNVQMGIMGPGSTDAPSQPISVSKSMQIGLMNPPVYSMASEQFLLPSKQPGQMGMMLKNAEFQQPSVSGKRKAPMESTSGNPAVQKLTMPNKRFAQMEHRPWLQQISSPNKSPMQTQSLSNSNTSTVQRSQAPPKRSTSGKGIQQLSVHKNQSGQPSPKIPNESSESVRSKLRESLAGALALVSQQQDRTSSEGNKSANEGVISEEPMQEQKRSVPSNDGPMPQKRNDGQSSLQEISSNNTGDYMQMPKNNNQDYVSTISYRDEDASFSDSLFVKDELLQGNGLSWVLEPDMRVAEERDYEIVHEQSEHEDFLRDSSKQALPSPEFLASEIEAELYKLFGGVNKKYKEKGRSLLFNLKDRNNPELRERVMSGEIPPDRLCSMTAEELASKELSEWRIAKAEELAQMVVLPDTDVDMRRLVKKTHKGEFQVEVEPQDSVSAEIAVGSSLLTQIRPKPKEEASSPSEPDKTKTKAKSAAGEKTNSQEENVLMIPSSEGNDLMQGLMVDDELKDSEFLPPIVSLDEFMESLNSEPPFVILPAENGKPTSVSEKDNSKTGTESKSLDSTPVYPGDASSTKPDIADVTNTKPDHDKKSSDIDVKQEGARLKPAHDKKSSDNDVKQEGARLVDMPKGEQVWEGLLQLNVSATASVIGIYKSGEKTSAKDWPGFVDIKGRVRLDAFEKFLQELPMSRTRAVMALHFVCKDGSAESEHAGLSEVAESYVMDGRVGFGEPTPGVELYFCPPHSKTTEMLGKVFSKEELDTLNAIDNGLIGVIVWRKPQIISSHHKHNSKKQHLSSRRHQEKDSNVNVNSSHAGPNPQPDEDDDVPPGFGPPASWDEDDLPEFNFSSGSVTRRSHQMAASFHSHAQTHQRPVEQMRQLVQRYGQPITNATNRSVGVALQPWNDDDDDMPEWRPEDNKPQLARLHPQAAAHMQQPIVHAQMTPHQIHLPMQTQQLNAHNVATSLQAQGPWMVQSGVPHGLTPPPYQQQQEGMPWRRDPTNARGF